MLQYTMTVDEGDDIELVSWSEGKESVVDDVKETVER